MGNNRKLAGLVIAALVALIPAAIVTARPSATAADLPTSVGRAESCVIDANSGCTISHGFGVKPTSIVAVNGGGDGTILRIDPSLTTDTTYRITFMRHDGAKYAAGCCTARFYVHFDLPVVSPSPSPTLSTGPSPTLSPSPTPAPSPIPAPSPTPSPSLSPSPSPAGMSVRVVGNHLIDSAGQTLQLRGVNRSGTQYACMDGYGFGDGPLDAASVDAMKTWGMNAVRVNGNEDCALNINGIPSSAACGGSCGGVNYLNALKTYVNLLHSRGMYAIVDMHHSAPGTQKALDQQPMADRDHAPAYWTTMANAFKDDPAVIFDLYNEPYPDGGNNSTAAWTCIKNGGICPGVSFVAAGMQELLNAVRATGATNVVITGGTNWAGYLDRWLEFKPADPLGQLAASVHVYAQPLGSPYESPASWDGDIATLAQTTPVIAGEGMDTNCTHATSDQWFPWADSHGVSYLFWAWVTSSCAGEPALISNYNGTPTAYGIGLRNWLQTH